MDKHIIPVYVDLALRGPTKIVSNALLTTNDRAAHRINVVLTKYGAPADLSGITKVRGLFSTSYTSGEIEGSYSGNTVSVVLNEACYKQGILKVVVVMESVNASVAVAQVFFYVTEGITSGSYYPDNPSVDSLTITKNLSSTYEVAEHSNVELYIIAEAPPSYPPITYQWYYKKDSSDDWHTTSMEGNKTNRLTFEAYKSYTGRIFKCVATSKNEEVTSNSMELIVKDEGDIPVVDPVITKQPTDYVVPADGGLAVFSIEATGRDLNYIWQYNSSRFSIDWTDVSDSSSGMSVNSFNELIVVADERNAAREYRCKVYSSKDTSRVVYSDKATIYVGTEAPTIQRVEPGSAVMTRYGEPLSITVTATGREPLAYKWESRIGNTGMWGPASGSGNEPTYRIAKIEDDSVFNRTYRCTVTNAYGSAVTGDIVVYKKNTIVIDKQPEDYTSETGRVYISILAHSEDGLDLYYMWQRSEDGGNTWSSFGLPVKGANYMDYLITDYDASKSYKYRCAIFEGDRDYGAITISDTATYVKDSGYSYTDRSAINNTTGDVMKYSNVDIGTDHLYDWASTADYIEIPAGSTTALVYSNQIPYIQTQLYPEVVLVGVAFYKYVNGRYVFTEITEGKRGTYDVDLNNTSYGTMKEYTYIIPSGATHMKFSVVSTRSNDTFKLKAYAKFK